MYKLFVKRSGEKSFLTFNTYKCTFKIYKTDLFICLFVRPTKTFALRFNECVFKTHLNVFYSIKYVIYLYVYV